MRLFGNVAGLLRDDQIDFPVEAILQKARPSRRIFHVWRGTPFVYIKANKFPIRTQRERVQELLFMGRQVVFISGLIEVADIHGYLKIVLGKGTFVLDVFEPDPMLCQAGLTLCTFIQ